MLSMGKTHYERKLDLTVARASSRSFFDRLKTNGYTATALASNDPIACFATYQFPLRSHYVCF